MRTTTVEHLPSGRRWTVETPNHRPSNLRRAALRLQHARTVAPGWVACEGCERATPTRPRTVEAPDLGLTVVVGPAEADRVVNHHPAFRVTEPVGYGDATVLNVCSVCNGSDARTAPATRANLEAAALRVLAACGTELPADRFAGVW